MTPLYCRSLKIAKNTSHLGNFNTCFTNAGVLSCFGEGTGIMLGFQGTTSPTPITILQAPVTTFDIGSNHACAERNGVLSCWGSNNYGQLGDGVGTDTIQGLTTVNY